MSACSILHARSTTRGTTPEDARKQNVALSLKGV